MKRLLLCLLALHALAVSEGKSAGTGPLKIGIVDMERIYMNYHKTRENEAEIDKFKADARNEIEKRDKKLAELKNKADERIKIVQNNQLGIEARKRAERELQGLEAEFQSLVKDKMELGRKRKEMLIDELTRRKRILVNELQKIVIEKSKAEEYDLVFDKSGTSPNMVPFLLFSKDAIDFTDDLLKIVNAGAGEAKPPGATGEDPAKSSDLLEDPPTEEKPATEINPDAPSGGNKPATKP